MLPLLVVCHLLHRCFSQAIARLFFKWLLPADVPQFPGVCVVLSTEPKLSDALDILRCRCLFELEGLQHCTSLTSLLLPGCLVTISLSKQASLLFSLLVLLYITNSVPGPHKASFCGAWNELTELLWSVHPIKELTSPIIRAAEFYLPVDSVRKAGCNS